MARQGLTVAKATNLTRGQARCDVEHVRWGEECAELILKNGLAVKTAGDYDYNVVCALFGSNVSTYTYTRLKKEE